MRNTYFTNFNLQFFINLLLILSIVGCRSNQDVSKSVVSTETPIHVTTAQAVERPMPRHLTLTGTLIAEQESEVAADTAGKVVYVSAERGTFVDKGKLLAKLDTRGAALTSREATAGAELAKAQLAQANADCARAEALFKTGGISHAEYERMRTQCTASERSLEAAEARRDATLKLLGDTSIVAPLSGMIAERYIDIGEYVRPDSRIVKIVSIDKLRLQLSVPESVIPSVKQGSQVEFTVAAFPSTPFHATIQFIGASVRELTRDLLVEANVDNKDLKLRPGMFSVATIDLPKETSIAIPKESLQLDKATGRVFVVNHDRLEERIVDVGTQDGNFIEIRKGIKSGETVVSPWNTSAKDGTTVQL